MRYYCNICRKDITKAEFLYSIDKFDRPLCRKHQQLEREIKESPIEPSMRSEVESQTEHIKEAPAEETQSKWKSLVKKAVVATGKGIIKGAKKNRRFNTKDNANSTMER